MSTPRQQHEVPRFYLEHFACRHSGRVEAYNFGSNQTYQQQPAELATLRDAYVFTRKDGTKDYGLEKLYAKSEMDVAGDIYRKVLAQEGLTTKERADFTTFIACMYLRSPNFLRTYITMQGQIFTTWLYAHADDENAWRTVTTDLVEQGVSAEAIEKVRQELIARKACELDIPRESALDSIQHLDKVAETLFSMKWTFLRASRGNFITGDSPAVLGQLVGPVGPVGFKSKRALFTFPIASNLCLWCHWRKEIPPVVRASAAFIRDMNMARASYADKKIFAVPNSHNLIGLAEGKKAGETRVHIAGFGFNGPAKVHMTRRPRR